MDVQLPSRQMPFSRRIGYGEAARALCAWVYHAPGACALDDDVCIESHLNKTAHARGTSVDDVRQRTLNECMREYVLGPSSTQNPTATAPTRGRHHLQPLHSTICTRSDERQPPLLWIVVIVRLQSRGLTHWLSWHLALGASRILVFDNHRENEQVARAALAASVAPFGDRVRLIRWAGDARQNAANERALQLASAANVSFLGALDADEYAAPFADGCLTNLLESCLDAARCGGISLNWRMTMASAITHDPLVDATSHGRSGGRRVVPSDPGGVAREVSLLRAVGFETGRLDLHVKTFARVATHRAGSFAAHNNVPTSPFCLFGEDLKPIRGCRGASWARSPPTGARALIVHAKCTSLIHWVFKRSMRGEVAFSISAVRCPTCSGSLTAIWDEFNRTCAREAMTLEGGTSAARGLLDGEVRERLGVFLRRMDAAVAR